MDRREEGNTPEPVIESGRLRLIWMSPEFIAASLHGDRVRAEALLGAWLPDEWPDQSAAARLAMRLDQMTREPRAAAWLLRAMVNRHDDRLVGYINFHGPPEAGRAELGYTVLMEHRRQGFASEAAWAMMKWAYQSHGVDVFVVSISPANEPSLRMAEKLGFRKVGEQMDEVDGLEWVFELDRA